MFKRAVDVRGQQRLSGADRKKLRRALRDGLPQRKGRRPRPRAAGPRSASWQPSLPTGSSHCHLSALTASWQMSVLAHYQLSLSALSASCMCQLSLSALTVSCQCPSLSASCNRQLSCVQGDVMVSKLANRALVYALEGGPPMLFDASGRGA